MEFGHCPKCATPYGPAEVAAYGVLRPRRAADGGPWMEYGCASCGRQIRLVPHGMGRYAPPGQPPPPAVSKEDLRPPWMSPDDETPRDVPGADVCEPTQEPPDPPRQQPPPPQAPPPQAPPPEPVTIEDFGGGAREAREILGISNAATTKEIEKAFRARSKTCHPDKVAHLDREFQELANAKFRRLRAAFDLLRE